MTTAQRPRVARRACVCDWPADERCNGAGVVSCEGCGGDLCVCVCGGSRDCGGCEACEPCPLRDDFEP